MKVGWARFKAFVDSRSLSVHWEDLGEGSHYIVAASDGPLYRECEVDHAEAGQEGADQLDFEANYRDLAESNHTFTTATTHAQKVAIYEGEGDSTTVPSHDWTDKTTWYQESTRVIGETLTLDAGLVYDFANTYLIDCDHGKITFENEICAAYDLIIYDNAVEVDKADYNVDYVSGKVTFNSAPTGPVTSDYSYAGDSTFTIPVPPGEARLNIKDAEINFEHSGFLMRPTYFEIWLNHPIAGWIPVFSKKYNNIRDIINIARRGTGEIIATDVLTGNVSIYPIHYDKRIILDSTLEMELRIFTENHQPMMGTWATITVYTEIDS